jgi:hypothetical protein
MLGTVNESTYSYWVQNLTWFSEKTPTKFEGFNKPLNVWPFWSSKSITYAMTLLLNAKLNALEA